MAKTNYNDPVPLLVSRLMLHYDVFGALGILHDIEPVDSAEPRDFLYRHEDRTEAYHYGRIKQMLLVPDTAPIEVDAGIPRYSNYDVEVLDGHHRLCAAILRGDETILASCGGWISFLNYMAGKRKTDPWIRGR